MNYYLRQEGYVFVGISLLVWKQDYEKTTRPIFINSGKKVAHGHRKKSLDFGGNPDHVMFGFVLGYGGYGVVAAEW